MVLDERYREKAMQHESIRYRGTEVSAKVQLTLGSPYARECERSSVVCLLEGLSRMSQCLGLGFARRVKPQSPCTFEARLWR